jgi:hypothetical protein
MNLLFTLLAHVLRNVAILLQPGGAKSIIAENLLLKQQLLVLNRSRRRAPTHTAPNSDSDNQYWKTRSGNDEDGCRSSRQAHWAD